MSEWREYKLAEIAQLVKDSWKVGDERLPYIALEHIVENSLRLQEIGDSSNIVSNKYRFNSDSFLFGKLRPYFRKLYRPDFEGVCSTDIWVIKPKSKNSKDFLFYFFANQEFVDFSYSGASGTRMPRADWKFVSQAKWMFPDPAEQKAIAEVLSSLDDKIDLLHRQNKTLEKMAETLFRQWFVEEAEEDWEVKPLREYFQLLGGFAFKSKDYLEVGKYKVITIKGVQDGYLDSNSSARLDILPEKIKPYQILNIGDILMSLTGNVGRVCLVDEDNCLLNQRVAKIEPIDKEWKAFAYFYFRQNEMIERLTYLSKGSAQLNLSPVETLAQNELFPNDSSIRNYCGVVNPYLFKIMKNKTQIHTLAALRDTLLPKLMRGEVRVKN